MGRCVLSMDSSPTVGSVYPTTYNQQPAPFSSNLLRDARFSLTNSTTSKYLPVTLAPPPPAPKSPVGHPQKEPPPQKTVAPAAQPIKKLPLQLTYLPTPTMNTPLLVARRAAAAATSSVCLSCRRTLLRRQFSSVGGRAALPAEFQSYRLNTATAGPQPRGGPDTSISSHLPVVDSPPPPPLPRLHETRPPSPPQQPSPLREGQGQAQEEYAAAATTQQQQEQPPTPAPQQQQQQQETEQSTTTTTSSTQSTTTTTTTSAAAAAAATPKTTTTTTRPRSKLRAPRKAAITLSPAAVAHLRALLDQPAPKLIKVGVRNRGCSGLAYHLEYVDKAGAFDEAVEQDGVRVLIDSKALFSIIGSEMDWVEDKLNQRFVFRNPNISEFFFPLLPFLWLPMQVVAC